MEPAVAQKETGSEERPEETEIGYTPTERIAVRWERLEEALAGTMRGRAKVPEKEKGVRSRLREIRNVFCSITTSCW